MYAWNRANAVLTDQRRAKIRIMNAVRFLARFHRQNTFHVLNIPRVDVLPMILHDIRRHFVRGHVQSNIVRHAQDSSLGDLLHNPAGSLLQKVTRQNHNSAN